MPLPSPKPDEKGLVEVGGRRAGERMERVLGRATGRPLNTHKHTRSRWFCFPTGPLTPSLSRRSERRRQVVCLGVSGGGLAARARFFGENYGTRESTTSCFCKEESISSHRIVRYPFFKFVSRALVGWFKNRAAPLRLFSALSVTLKSGQRRVKGVTLPTIVRELRESLAGAVREVEDRHPARQICPSQGGS